VAAGPHQDRRLVVRSTQATDRRGYIELFCTDEGRGYLGGALDRDEVEAAMPATPRHRPGVFAVELAGAFIDVVTLVRRDPDRLGHVNESADEVEIGYMFLPASWGNGYATEAVTAVLDWAETHLPSEPIVLCTQSAHEASVRLATRLVPEVERFVEFGAEQWFGVRD
jgi:RimJ/RimL family protein N-acetyltransferase